MKTEEKERNKEKNVFVCCTLCCMLYNLWCSLSNSSEFVQNLLYIHDMENINLYLRDRGKLMFLVVVFTFNKFCLHTKLVWIH